MPGRTKLRQGLTQTSKEEGGSTARTTNQIEKYHSGGKRKFEYKKNDRGKVIKIELKGGGRAAYKDGSKGCGKANKGKGRAYGNNS